MSKKRERHAEPDYLKSLHATVDVIFAVAQDDKGWNWPTLASQAGVSYTTVFNLGYRVTKFPEFRTVYLLAKAVGLNLSVEAVGNTKRVSLKKAA